MIEENDLTRSDPGRVVSKRGGGVSDSTCWITTQQAATTSPLSLANGHGRGTQAGTKMKGGGGQAYVLSTLSQPPPKKGQRALQSMTSENATAASVQQAYGRVDSMQPRRGPYGAWPRMPSHGGMHAFTITVCGARCVCGVGAGATCVQLVDSAVLRCKHGDSGIMSWSQRGRGQPPHSRFPSTGSYPQPVSFAQLSKSVIAGELQPMTKYFSL